MCGTCTKIAKYWLWSENCFVFIDDSSATQYSRVKSIFLFHELLRVAIYICQTSAQTPTYPRMNSVTEMTILVARVVGVKTHSFILTKGHKLPAQAFSFRSNTFPSPAAFHICIKTFSFSRAFLIMNMSPDLAHNKWWSLSENENKQQSSCLFILEFGSRAALLCFQWIAKLKPATLYNSCGYHSWFAKYFCGWMSQLLV